MQETKSEELKKKKLIIESNTLKYGLDEVLFEYCGDPEEKELKTEVKKAMFYCNMDTSDKTLVDDLTSEAHATLTEAVYRYKPRNAKIDTGELSNEDRKKTIKTEFKKLFSTMLANTCKSKMTAEGRQKRSNKIKSVDENGNEKLISIKPVSLDEHLGDENSDTIRDCIESDFDVHTEYELGSDIFTDQLVQEYLSCLSDKAKEVVYSIGRGSYGHEVIEDCNLTKAEYKKAKKELKESKNAEKLIPLRKKYGFLDDIEETKITNEKESKGVKIMNDSFTINENNQKVVTNEISKDEMLPAYGIQDAIENYEILINHPLQRESGQWNLEMKSNLITTMLNGYPITPIITAEQLAGNDDTLVWLLDGKQRTSTIIEFRNNAFKISKKAELPVVKYRIPKRDESGIPIVDPVSKEPSFDYHECDVRGKFYKDLPDVLRKKFDLFRVPITKMLACTEDKVAFHIRRYNNAKVMSAAQKGITHLIESLSREAKNITSRSDFFKNAEELTSIKKSEFNNGTVERIVVESVMAINFVKDWKKSQPDMCDYLSDNASVGDFEAFGELTDRLYKVMNESVKEFWTSKQAFTWFAIFNAFCIKNYGVNDSEFIKFMAEANTTLIDKEVNGTSLTKLNEKSGKDKSVVLAKLELIETLMDEYFLGNFKVEDTETTEEIEENIVETVEVEKSVEEIEEQVATEIESIEDTVVEEANLVIEEVNDEIETVDDEIEADTEVEEPTIEEEIIEEAQEVEELEVDPEIEAMEITEEQAIQLEKEMVEAATGEPYEETVEETETTEDLIVLDTQNDTDVEAMKDIINEKASSDRMAHLNDVQKVIASYTEDYFENNLLKDCPLRNGERVQVTLDTLELFGSYDGGETRNPFDYLDLDNKEDLFELLKKMRTVISKTEELNNWADEVDIHECELFDITNIPALVFTVAYVENAEYEVEDFLDWFKDICNRYGSEIPRFDNEMSNVSKVKFLVSNLKDFIMVKHAPKEEVKEETSVEPKRKARNLDFDF